MYLGFYQKTDMHTGPYIFLVFGKSGIYLPALQVGLPLKWTTGEVPRMLNCTPGRRNKAPLTMFNTVRNQESENSENIRFSNWIFQVSAV